MKVSIVLRTAEIIPDDRSEWIGVDQGAAFLAGMGIHMVCAIGDFDSIDKKDLDLIRQYSDEVIELNPIKDDTDCQAAIEKAIALGYQQMDVYGALGGRIDHELINLRLALQYPDRVVIKDQRNLIMAYGPGEHHVIKDDYPYFSFFTQSEDYLTLKGFSYPLDRRKIMYTDLYTVSNELSEDTGIFINEKNPILLVRSRDEKKDS